MVKATATAATNATAMLTEKIPLRGYCPKGKLGNKILCDKNCIRIKIQIQHGGTMNCVAVWSEFEL